MKIIYKNFTIEQDRSCYILSEYGKISKGKNKGTVGIIDQIYPITLENCIKDMMYRVVKNKPSTVELGGFLEQLKEINNQFLVELKEIIGDIQQ